MVQRDEIELRLHRPLTPADLLDPPRFGQPQELAKDSVILALREYFDRSQTSIRAAENVTFEKYATGFAVGTDPFETTVQLLEEFPDLLENLPHVAITSSSGRNRRLSIGRPMLAVIQLPPRIDTIEVEPFALEDGLVLRYRTMPDGINWVDASVIFPATRFPTTAPIGAALAVDVARVINEQALYAEAVALPSGAVRLQCGGPLSFSRGAESRNNAIEILDTSDPEVLTAFGWDGTEADDTTNVLRPPLHRYHQATEVQLSLDIICSDSNTRRELTDLVYSWATFWMERQHFQLWGRGTFDAEAFPDENYQISLHQEINWGGESAVARPGDGKDKVHLQRVTVPLTVIQYLDRSVTVASGPEAGAGWVLDSEDDIAFDEEVPPTS